MNATNELPKPSPPGTLTTDGTSSVPPKDRLPWVGFLSPFDPLKEFVQDPKRDWRLIRVWSSLIILVVVAMAVSVGSDSRGIEPLPGGNQTCSTTTGVGFL